MLSTAGSNTMTKDSNIFLKRSNRNFSLSDFIFLFRHMRILSLGIIFYSSCCINAQVENQRKEFWAVEFTCYCSSTETASSAGASSALHRSLTNTTQTRPANIHFRINSSVWFNCLNSTIRGNQNKHAQDWLLCNGGKSHVTGRRLKRVLTGGADHRSPGTRKHKCHEVRRGGVKLK